MSSSEKNKTLFFFTASFPYGNKAETFIETEIRYLSTGFDKVVIFPSSAESDFIRPVPENVEINNSFLKTPKARKKKISITLKWIRSLLSVFTSEISKKGFVNVFRHARTYLDIFSVQASKAEIIRSFLQTYDNKNIVFYDYWFENSTLALAILKKKKTINDFICRGHGFDIYDERWGSIGVPFRSFKLTQLKSLYVISNYGKKYVLSKTPVQHHSKIKTNYLGVEHHSAVTHAAKGFEPLLISVSGLTKSKNTVCISDTLRRIKSPLKWIHFGDGEEMNNLKKKCEELPANIEWCLMGHVSNNDLMKFYSDNQVDLFISLSDSEGLPVSMMEAISFGVPIVAYPVNGIPEILKEELTGFYLKSCNHTEYNAEVLSRALEYPFDRQGIIDFFRQNFDAANNYRKFVDEISA